MEQYKQTIHATNQKKDALEADILKHRKLYEQQIQRHADIRSRQKDLANQNGGSSVKGSDIIHINVGGMKMHIHYRDEVQCKATRCSNPRNRRISSTFM